MTTYPPTDEQAAAIELFSTGGPLVIKAGAGTGKTTTLGMCARTTPRTGTYLAFNKAIAQDAGRAMPHTVDARTVHSVAYRATRQTPTGGALLDRLNAGRVAPWDVARILDLASGPVIVEVPQPEGPPRKKVLQPTTLASHVTRALAVFCNSADPVPGTQHFPYLEGIDPMVDGRRTYVNNRQVARHLLPTLQRAWADVTRPTGSLRFTPDVYLKLWELAGAPIPGDYVLFDEAQDASGVMLAALDKAAARGQQVIYVGDENQQIYEWRGAVNALDLVDADMPRTMLTQSWRFGDAVAAVANQVLARLDTELVLRGTPSIPTQVYAAGGAPRPRAMLCRTNGAAVNAVIGFQAQGMNPHLVGGSAAIVSFAEAAIKLQSGQKTMHPELVCFDTWREVQEYVNDDPSGGDLKTMVRLLDDYGPQIVMDALAGLVGEDAADVIVSTAHKAKGREWDAVRLGPDFDLPEGQDIPAGELRLLYVSATRATHHLDITQCVPLRDIVAGVDAA